MTPKSTHKIFVTTGSSNHTSKNRSDNDLYTTDPKALERLLDVKPLHSSVWECACGLGHLSEVLRDNGYEVYSSDIKNYGYKHQNEELDFLSYSQKGRANLDIVTNPPYLKALEFCAKALEIINDGYYVVMFLRLQFLEGKKRKAFFDKSNHERTKKRRNIILYTSVPERSCQYDLRPSPSSLSRAKRIWTVSDRRLILFVCHCFRVLCIGRYSKKLLQCTGDRAGI